MKVVPEELRKFFRQWLATLRRAETEALIYRQVTEVLRTIAPDLVRQTEEAARKNQKVLKMLDAKYSQYERIVDESIDKGHLDQALSQFLRDWKPEGPIN